MKQESNQNHQYESMDVIEILNEIQKYPEESLIEKLTSFCEETEYDPMELGEILAENEHFKRVLWMDAVMHNQIKDEGLKIILNQTENQDEW